MAVHPPATHPESARDIAYPDEPVGWPSQFGRDPVRDRFDVLFVESHRLNGGWPRPLEVPSVVALREGPPIWAGAIAPKTRRSKWRLDLTIAPLINSVKRLQAVLNGCNRVAPLHAKLEQRGLRAQQLRRSLGRAGAWTQLT